jgi:hypothetical protein
MINIKRKFQEDGEIIEEIKLKHPDHSEKTD